MDRVWTVIGKELYETLHNRVTMLTMIIPSLLFVILPLGTLYFTSAGGPLEQWIGPDSVSQQDLEELQHLMPNYGDMTGVELTQAITMTSFQAMFLIIPLMVPMIIATYSVIGEKQNRSLEPLLVTPIETWELLVGKALAAAVPGFLISWVSYGLLMLLAPLMTSGRLYSAVVLNPAWLGALLLLGPLLAFLAVMLALIVSSRARDAQSAQQIAGFVVLPVVALMIGQLSGLVQLSLLLVLLIGVVVLAIDIGLTMLAVGLFQRETILTRWK